MIADTIAAWLSKRSTSPSHSEVGQDTSSASCPCPVVVTSYYDDEQLISIGRLSGRCSGCGDGVTLTRQLYGRALRSDAAYLESDGGRRPDLVEAWRATADRLDPDPRQLSLPAVSEAP